MTVRHPLGEAHRLAATHVDKSQLDDLLALLCSVTLHLGTARQPFLKKQFPWASLKNYRPPGTVEKTCGETVEKTVEKTCSGQRTPVRGNGAARDKEEAALPHRTAGPLVCSHLPPSMSQQSVRHQLYLQGRVINLN